MTRIASFGPIFVVSALHLPPRYVLCKIQPIHIIRHWKKANNIKKRLTCGPNDAKHVVWARFLRQCLPLTPPCH